MFKPVSPKLNITVMEEDVLRFWKREQIFEKSSAQGQGSAEFVFYEGPPTANGVPGVHHILARAFKDVFPRYKSMRGYHVVRRGGWDTHGLPVEIAVEKQLGFTSKAQIEEYGIARFNQLCRRSAFNYIQDWERLTDRIAFWVSLQDAYVTFTNEYIESVWWILKTLWEKDLLYQGHKVVPYCPRCGTPLSDHEVSLGYQEVDDPSIFVRLPLVDEARTSLLVWTTTPWTLPGNVAVAAHPETEYVTVERSLPEGGTERLILARPLVEKVFGDEPVRIVDSFKGRKLKGKRYKPLFTYLLPDKPAYSVILGDFVTTEDGSGLVHIAPAFGAEDMQAAQELDLPVLMTVTPEGTFIPEVRSWSGRFVKDADPLIIQDLDARGLMFRSGTYSHTYPFCWRCDTPLIYYARGTWYIRTSQYKDRLVDLNQRINWVPSHIKNGRFGNWLENNVDWALGRERYWGTPLPVWECEFCHRQICVGSIAELAELAEKDLAGLDLHRPHVDEVHFPCPDCGPTSGAQMQRVPELIDVWFDSGSMPVAQWHYPFENQDEFARQYPADFICEAVDQTRGWFYSLHAISTLLFDQEAYRNVICLGLVLDENGQKMSKSRRNAVDPWEVINQHGADAFRWYLYTASPPGQERRFSSNLVGEVVRNFTLTLWNVYSFFVTYANLDSWSPQASGDTQNEQSYTNLDRWLLSELHTLIQSVTEALENYDVTGATRPIQVFVDDLSKWFLRRSRRRFWKSETDADKQSAYAILYETLVALSKLLAPSMPFLAEEMYQNLVRAFDDQAPGSVHLADWPAVDPTRIDPTLNNEMHLVMKLASLGHAARNQAGIKVRQPLSEAAFSVSNREEVRVLEKFADLLSDELNVKQVRALGSAGEAVSYSLKPLPKQLGGKYKALYPKISAAILNLDTEGAARALLGGHNLLAAVEGQAYTVLPEDVEVRTEARAGYVVASEGAYLAALKTELTPELIQEGLAREFVRHVQELRKQAGLDIADRIHLSAVATSLLADAIAAHRSYIVGETLARSLDDHPLKAAPTVFTAALEFDGERAQVSLYKDLSMSYIDWLRSRVGHRKIVLTFTSVILRDEQDRILLQQRSDFDAWGLLGGVLEFGESILDCARRELFEETGLTAGDLGLVGVYSEPEFDVDYPNGDQVQQYTICLQGRVKGGNLRADGQESRAVQFFAPGELPLPQIPPWYRAMLNDLLRSAGGAAGFDPPISRTVLLPQIDTMRSLLGGEAFIGAAVAAVTLDRDGRFLVTRSQGTGEWCLPLRYLHLGENAAHAAQRAAYEEAGLRVEPQRILGVYSPPEIWAHPLHGAIQPVITVFSCPPTQGEPVLDLPAHAAWIQPAEILSLPLSPIFAGLCRAVLEHQESAPFVQ